MGAPTTPYQPYAKEHKDLSGPGDARPTALQIIEDEKLVGKWTDKVVIITGCTAGIGIETAKALHTTGAKLFLTVRNKEKGEKVVEDILSSSKGSSSIELIHMDLSSLESVRAAAKDFLSRSKQLNVLINNAGVMATPQGKTVDGFETQLGTNHFGHFLFFQLLKPTLLESSKPDFASRVINVASAGHQRGGIRFDDLNFDNGGYEPFAAYGQSKTANIYMAHSIDRHYGSQGLHGLAIHPGVIFDTELGRHFDFSVMGKDFMEGIKKISKSTQQGAATTVWAATAAHWEGKGGRYLADCGESAPVAEDEAGGGPGYAPHAYDEAAEEKLWKLSYEKVGLKED